MPSTLVFRTSLGLLCLTALSSCVFYHGKSTTGANLFRRERCIDCHGELGVGTPNGPRLRGLSEFWSTDGLIDYLADPEEYRPHDPRLAALAIKYKTRMASFAYLSVNKRRSIANYLLSQG